MANKMPEQRRSELRSQLEGAIHPGREELEARTPLLMAVGS